MCGRTHIYTAFVRDLVACLGKLLMAQEVDSWLWSSPSTLKTFYVLLSYFREKCVHQLCGFVSTVYRRCVQLCGAHGHGCVFPNPLAVTIRRPKVRKAAMAATVEMLRLHAGKRVWALGRQVADFSNSVLAACTASDCLPTLHLLGFLQEVSGPDGWEAKSVVLSASTTWTSTHPFVQTGHFIHQSRIHRPTGSALPAEGGHPQAG